MNFEIQKVAMPLELKLSGKPAKSRWLYCQVTL